MLQIQCPTCKQALQIPDEARGKTVRCPKCNQTMMIPAPPVKNPPAPPVPPPAAPLPAPTHAAPVPISPPPAQNEPVEEESAFSFTEDAGEPGPPRGRVEFPKLGRTLQEFLPRKWWIGIAICAALVVIGVPWALLVWSSNSKAKIAPPMILNAVGVGGILIFALLFFLGFKVRILVCELGFVYQRFSTTSCPWTEIASVTSWTQGMLQSRHLQIGLKDGQTITIPDILPRLTELYAKIGQATKPVLLPMVLKSLNRGEAVSFGDYLSISSQGIRSEDRRLNWDEVKAVNFGRYPVNPGGIQSLLRFAANDPKQVIDVSPSYIPNLHVLLDLLENRFQIKVERDPHIMPAI